MSSNTSYDWISNNTIAVVIIVAAVSSITFVCSLVGKFVALKLKEIQRRRKLKRQRENYRFRKSSPLSNDPTRLRSWFAFARNGRPSSENGRYQMRTFGGQNSLNEKLFDINRCDVGRRLQRDEAQNPQRHFEEHASPVSATFKQLGLDRELGHTLDSFMQQLENNNLSPMPQTPPRFRRHSKDNGILQVFQNLQNTGLPVSGCLHFSDGSSFILPPSSKTIGHISGTQVSRCENLRQDDLSQNHIGVYSSKSGCSSSSVPSQDNQSTKSSSDSCLPKVIVHREDAKTSDSAKSIHTDQKQATQMISTPNLNDNLSPPYLTAKFFANQELSSSHEHNVAKGKQHWSEAGNTGPPPKLDSPVVVRSFNNSQEIGTKDMKEIVASCQRNRDNETKNEEMPGPVIDENNFRDQYQTSSFQNIDDIKVPDGLDRKRNALVKISFVCNQCGQELHLEDDRKTENVSLSNKLLRFSAGHVNVGRFLRPKHVGEASANKFSWLGFSKKSALENSGYRQIN